MRGKLFALFLLLIAVFNLTSCVRSIESPTDELKMYSWSGVSDNGTAVSLCFSQTCGYLDIEQDDESLHIGGLCMTTDNSMQIFDEQSGMNYSFGYRLYGDRVELNHNGSILSLKKNDPE